ncbi:glycosyltransferase [Sphingomonas sp. Root710]|uniref:glycosyltransferase n=1 Tax=Sphingomonas sp. Root710 TaxID=1736594 RepID=UPI001F34C627|nr:hypothetical protein [Sphingomonas sp. Root710]
MVAVMIERMFHREYLDRYEVRALLPNPEWLDPRDIETKGGAIDVVLHKTRFSIGCLQPRFAKASHHFLGFTSADPGKTVQNYDTFCHFRGKARTRHTQLLMNIWQRRPDLPRLMLQAYGPDMALRTGRWLTDENISCLFDFVKSDEQFFADLARGGIHLCPSGTEGFGHYINESRAMSALVLTLDAPPMNELVTSDSGILIPATSSEPLMAGTNFTTTELLIEDAVDRALSLSHTDRQELGRAARRAFERERSCFLDNVRAFLADHHLPH